MKAEIQELRNKRLNIVNQMQDFAKRGATEGDTARRDELFASFDKAEAEERAIGKQIEAIERLDQIQRREAEQHAPEAPEQRGKPAVPTATPEYRDAFEQFFRFGAEALTDEQRAALRLGYGQEQRGTNPQSTTGNLGGYTIPTGFLPELVKSMKQYSAVMEAARIYETETGNTLYLPTSDDTSTAATLVAENAATTVQDLTFGQKQLDAYAFRSLIKISEELMQDSAFNLENEVGEIFADRFGRAFNSYLTTGTGSSQPNGVVTAASAGVTSAGATAIAFNDVLGLIHSVDPAYRYRTTAAGFKNRIEKGQGAVGFMMHDNVLLAIKKVAAAAGSASPLWMPSLREGEPDTIFGYPYWINQDMANAVATTNITMLFGDFSKYVVRMVRNLRVRRLNERFADNEQIGFAAFARIDGECLNTAAIKKLTQA